MMRYLDEKQKSLYKSFAMLGTRIVEYEHSLHQQKTVLDHAWEMITKEGIWRIPISTENGGVGLGWQECIVAIEGLASTYHNLEFITLIIKQINALYYILHYGSQEDKRIYTPRLLQGAVAQIHISKSFQEFAHIEYLLTAHKKHISVNFIPVINIIWMKLENNISCSVADETNSLIETDKLLRLNRVRFFSIDEGISILYNIINFERIMYSILSASISLAMVKNNSRENEHLLDENKIFSQAISIAIANVQKSHDFLYSKISGLD